MWLQYSACSRLRTVEGNICWVSCVCVFNRPFPRCLKPLFQSEAQCEAIDMKMIFYSHANRTHFNIKLLHLHLALFLK